MFLVHCPTNALQVGVPIESALPNRFGNDHQMLAILQRHRERGHRTGLNRIAGHLDRLFDVLRISVHTADDNHVLQTAGNIQLAIMQEPKVTRTQKRPLAISGHAAESLLGRSQRLPIPLADRRALNPDFADFARWQDLKRIG